ncbi:MAG: fructokinase [Moraxellaceae bacterium]|nr:MAG: fructokinase [Moraxellaceae bacterium]
MPAKGANLGVDLGGTKIEAVVLDTQGEVCWRKRVPTPQQNYDLTLAVIAQLVSDAKRDTDMASSAPVGIGTPGALTQNLSTKQWLMKNCNSTALNGRPLREDLAALLQCSVFLANDANCFALAETLSGQGKQLFPDDPPETVFGVILGTGVGGGIVVRGKVLQGANAIAGEWGHNPLSTQCLNIDGERPCYCGRVNCIETFLSGPGLTVSYQMEFGYALSPEQIIQAMRQGDANAVSICNQYRQQLALSLAQVVNVMDPSLIVLGGGMSTIPELIQEITSVMKSYVFSDRFATPVVAAQLGDSAGGIGAAWLTR